MFIDTHIHEKTFSADSFIGLDEIVKRASDIGLDGICITDHESNEIMEKAHEHSLKTGFPIFVGAEVLTYEGDILVFGLEKLPKEMLHAQELINIVSKAGGVSISAHPYRDNNRGMGDLIRRVKGLHGVEVLNGSTKPHHNEYACSICSELGLSAIASSDAHTIESVGKNATFFHGRVRDVKDLVEAIKGGKTSASTLTSYGYEILDIHSRICSTMAI